MDKSIDFLKAQPFPAKSIIQQEFQNQEVLSQDAQKKSSVTFSEVLRDSIDQANLYQIQADQAVKEMIAGRTKNIHETLLAIERADASLKLVMQVRNKILDAYREIMRMQV